MVYIAVFSGRILSREIRARMVRLLSVLAVVLTLAACDTGTGGTRSTASATVTLSAPTVSPTTADLPNLASPSRTPTTTATLSAVPPVGCSRAEIADLLTRFFDAQGRGDTAALRSFFPQQGSPPGGPDGVTTHFQWYAVTDADPQQGRRPFVAYRLEDLWPYFAARHAQRERLQLTRLDVNNFTTDGVANIGYAIAREADDRPSHALSGKGAVNCRDQTIIVWSMGVSAEPPLIAPGVATPATPPRGTATR